MADRGSLGCAAAARVVVAKEAAQGVAVRVRVAEGRAPAVEVGEPARGIRRKIQASCDHQM